MRPIDDPNGTIRSYFPDYKPGTLTTAAFDERGKRGGDDGYNYDIWRGSVTVDVDLGSDLTLTSITAATRINDHLTVDTDQSPLSLLWADQKSKYHQITQELRLASSANGPLSYIVGAWFRHAKQDKAFASSLGPVGAALTSTVPFTQKTDTFSVFADAQYRLTDQLKLGGTVRYTTEKKVGTISAIGDNPVFPAAPLQTTRLNPNFVDGSVRLQYEPKSDLMFYALYAHGTKTGALIDLITTATVVRPEKADTYEVGLKSTLAPGATFNLSAFRMDITGFQDIFTVALGGGLAFAAENRNLYTQGIEAQADWRVTREFKLSGSAAYMDSKDEAGGQGVRVPHWSLAGNARYELPVGSDGSSVALFASAFYRSSYFNRPGNNPARAITVSPGEFTADAGLEFKHSSGFNAKLLVQNLTDELLTPGVDLFALDPGVRSAALLPGRRVTLQIGLDF